MIKRQRNAIAAIVNLETGKSVKNALAEIDGAASLGYFFAGEGQRLYGRTTTSGVINRRAMTIRQPVGVAGLIAAANTPVANIAWKIFPALICGNAVVLKGPEDTPATSWIFGKIARDCGLPAGILNIVQGFGGEAGEALVDDPRVGVISFTGSTKIGKRIARRASERLAKVSLELGGKNAFVVCDDADMDAALYWSVLSAFSNAGQRCASASRILVDRSAYEIFRALLIDRVKKLRVGPGDRDDFGPVINGNQLERMLAAIEKAKKRGAHILTGGYRLKDPLHRRGYYLAPTLIDHVKPDDELARTELFGPVAVLFAADGFKRLLSLANNSPYGLTAAIHTRSVHRAWEFVEKVQTGVVSVNAGTYGSEPHMPFGGLKSSGNGTREPGTEALDIYSNLKDLYWSTDPKKL